MSTHAFVKFSRALIRDLQNRLGLEHTEFVVKALDLDLNCLCTALGEHLRNDLVDLVAPPKLPKRLHVRVMMPNNIELALSTLAHPGVMLDQVEASRSVNWAYEFDESYDAGQRQTVDVMLTLLRERGVAFIAPEGGLGFVPVMYTANVERYEVGK